MNSKPVYFVIVEPEVPTQYPQFQILTILHVVEADLFDYDTVYEKYIGPLHAQGRNVYTHIYRREPDNPFREKANEERRVTYWNG